MKYFSHIITFCLMAVFNLAASSVEAQTAALKKAKNHMDNLNYQTAIIEYSRIVENSDVAEAKINIAEAYRKIGDSDNAEFWYSQVVQLPESQPIHNLYYGQMLQRNGKCDLARDWYQKYIEEVPSDQRGQYLARACDYEEELMSKNDGLYEIKHLDFNSNLDDFSPALYKDQLIFASEREIKGPVQRESTWTGQSFLELYNVTIKEENGEKIYSRPEKYNKELNSKYHDAAVSFSQKQDEIYFTRNNFVNGKTGKSDEGIIKLKVFHAKSTGEDKWGDLESLPFNSDEYSVAHPTLSMDGNTLYFSSDMPGGYGGMDIYKSEKEGGRWGPPSNLGPTINTEGHEVFPTFDKNTDRVYYASDGLIGLGGYDIFYTKEMNPDEWTSPENLGFPINTISDDFGIIFDQSGKFGYFTSDRLGGVGEDDIYSFKKIAVPMEVLVYDAQTSEPIAGATVSLSCKDAEYTTDEFGKISFDIKPEDCCDFDASMAMYTPNTANACAKEEDFGGPQLVKIPLTKEKIFDLAVIVYDAETGLTIEGAEVTLENDCGDEIPATAYSDAGGRAMFSLKEDCCYRVKALLQPLYLANYAENICTKGFSSSETLTANINLQPTSNTGQLVDNNGQILDAPNYYEDSVTGLYIDSDTGDYANGSYPDGTVFEQGVRVGGGSISDNSGQIDNNNNEPDTFKPSGPVTEAGPIPFLLHIYYDFNKSYIRKDAEPELEKLLVILTDNPDIIIEIGSHTDARAGDRYNLRLSQRRAESVVRWLVDRGIERDRLVPRGYGESLAVNGCTNNIPCSERDHQLNRRTEFKVIGCKSCIDPASKSISKQNDHLKKIDKCQNCPF